MNKYHILIKDASRGRFRVCQMGPNGEMINQSEPLNTVDNVMKNILASARVFNIKGISQARKLRNEKRRRMQVCYLSLEYVQYVKYFGKNETLKKSFGQ